MPTTLRVLLLGGLLLQAVDAKAQLPGLCLDVGEAGPWYPDESSLASPRSRVPPPAADNYEKAFPPRIELGAEPRLRGRWRELIIPENSQQTPHSWRFWRASGDSLLISLSRGFGGLEARLQRSGPGWRGVLRTTTDNIGSLLYERTFVMVESTCDSPPPVAAALDPALPRTVELEGGRALALGEVLPENLQLEPRLEALMVLATPIGRFAGADTVIVRLNNSSRRVEQIDLRYPMAFEIGTLAASIEAEFGPGRPGTGIQWRNRTTAVRLYPGFAERRPRAVLNDPRLGFEPPD